MSSSGFSNADSPPRDEFPGNGRKFRLKNMGVFNAGHAKLLYTTTITHRSAKLLYSD